MRLECGVIALCSHLCLSGMGLADSRTAPVPVRAIGVFVALCDNEHQGIVPVPKAIGDGEDPERNLYWGNAEGLAGIFGRSARWKQSETSETASGEVLRQKTYRHESGKAVLTAFAYRGSAIKKCLEDFEEAICLGKYDLVVYIGHNGLMDFTLPQRSPETGRKNKPECVVLCCKSASYFRDRIESMEARPILLTKQFMYPGAFILRDVLEDWIRGADRKTCRASAGRAYAANQKISQKSALGVFADLER